MANMQENTTYLARLDDRTVLRVSGGDAADFLNGLVTADIAVLAEGAQTHAGLLAAQGKILFEFYVTRRDADFLIDVAASVADDLAKRLGFYKLRADVEIVRLEAAAVMAAWGTAPGEVHDPRLGDLGTRFIVEDAADAVFTAHVLPASLEDFETHRIALGVPEGIKDYPLGDTFPHEACFDQLGGVSFTKGCYVGQEVVSRMRHRGTARKRTIHIAADGALPERGTDVLAGERPIGAMGSSIGGQGIAMIRLDRAGKAMAAGTPITCGGLPVTLRVPAWADFSIDVPEGAA